MDELKTDVDTAAMVLGYPVIVIVTILAVWFGLRVLRDVNKIFNEMRYERWKRKNEERDLSNIISSWMLELDEDFYEDEHLNRFQRHDTDEFPAIQVRHDTNELPLIPPQRHDTVELTQLYNFQED